MKKLCFFSIIFFLISKTNCSSLDNLAIKFGTDKSSQWHNYARIYERYFDSFRTKQIRFLEIGFLLGHSAQMWQEYFVNAELFFIDVDPACIQKAANILKSRSKLFILNQADISQLNNFVSQTGGQLDIILDDGGHRMEQQINSFKVLFPILKSGGMYVIEDLHTSYWKDWGGYGTTQNPLSGKGTCVEFLQKLVDDLNFIGASTGCADASKCSKEIFKNLMIYQSAIESIHFYSSCCIIIKK